MADRPTASTSRTGRPRTRSESVQCIPVDPTTGKLSTTSMQTILTNGKGAGKGKKMLRK